MATPPTFTVGQVLTAAQINQVGLWRITDGTFTTSTGAAVDGVFTTDFKYYVAKFHITSHSTTLGYQLRFRNAGATELGSNYTFVVITTNSSSGTTQQSVARSQTISTLTQTTTAAPYSFEIEFANPKAAEPSFYWYEGQPAVGNRETSNGTYNANTSFDGFIILPTAGNFTGSYRIYGYN